MEKQGPANRKGKQMIKRADILGLMAITSLLHGCGTGQPTTEPVASTSALQLLQQQPGSGSVAEAEMYQLTPGAAHYQLIDEAGAGSGSVTQTRAVTDRYNASI